MPQNKATKPQNKPFVSKILWAAVSLLLALLVWVYYVSNYGEQITKTFSGVEVVFSGEATMRDQLSLIITQQDVTSVSVTIMGSKRDILRLTSADIKATVDLSNVTLTGYRSMSYKLTYPSDIDSADITITKRSPESVNIVVSKLATKVVELKGRFEGTTAEGYVPGAITFSPVSITLTGPEENLSQVSYALVVLDRDDVSAAFTTEANFTLVDAEGNELHFTDVTSDVTSVSATLPVRMTKEVALDVDLIDGGGATGANVIKTISPGTITLAGDAATLTAINRISLAVIDLSDYNTFPITEYSIIIPNDTENLSGITTASVSLEFTGLSTTFFTVSNLEYVNLEEGYTASIMTTTIIVTIRAPEATLSEISPNNIRAVADVSGMTTTGKVPTTIYVDGFPDAGAVGDYAMYVSIMPEAE